MAFQQVIGPVVQHVAALGIGTSGCAPGHGQMGGGEHDACGSLCGQVGGKGWHSAGQFRRATVGQA